MASRSKGPGVEIDSTVTSSTAPDAEVMPRLDIGAGTHVAERYTIVRLIGHGGMGEVYEAEDESLQQRVALKTIRSERAADRRAVERFKKEALLARRVTHRNVCRVFDVGYHAGEMFLTMELLTGETLAQRVRGGGRLEPAAALPLVEQMVAALAAAHHAGVVHRDFKCSNVMLTPDRVVVTDFGLAHDTTAAEHERSRDGFLGSPAYVAPEQVGGRQVSFASDIYSLGVVMFEMLTGQLPFVGATPMATAVLRLNEVAPSPKKLVSSIPETWERVILRCLEREPDDRYASVEDVLAALRNQPVAQPAGRGARGRGRIALAAVAVAIALAAAGAFGWRALRRHAVAPATADARRTLAVTDLADRTGRADEAWRGTAFAELLAAQLDGGDAMHVMPRATVAGKDRDQLARQGATLALVGSYRGSGESLTYDVQIVDLRSGSTVGSAEESGAKSAMLEVAGRAAARLRQALGLPALSPSDAPRTHSVLPANPEAARRYAEGLTALRRYQLGAAKTAFEASLAAEPDQPLVYSALAETWHGLESDQHEREAAQRAFELSASLPREQRLSIEAAYREAIKDWSGAAQIRLSLATFFPENLDYGLKLAEVQRRQGHTSDAYATFARLRRLAPPDGDDPRIDVAEANARKRNDSKTALAAAARGVDGAHRRGLRGVEAEAYRVECDTYANTGRAAEARVAGEQALRLFAAEGNRAGEAETLTSMANIYIVTHQQAEALKYENQALALFDSIGSRAGAVRVRALLALAHKRAGEVAVAEKMWRQVIDDSRELGEQSQMVNAMGDLASVYTDTGRYAEAMPMYRQVIETAHAAGYTNIEANSSSNFSIVLTRRGELAEARRFADLAVALWTKMEQRGDVVYGMDSVGQIAVRQGRLADAQKVEEQALALRESMGQSGGPSRQNLAELAVEQGDLPRAETLARKAMQEFVKDKRPSQEANALEVLTRILIEERKTVEAAAAVARIDQIIGQTQQAKAMFVGSHALVKAEQGDVPGALAMVRATIADCDKDGDVDTAMDLRYVLAQVLVRHGPRDEARKAVATVKREAAAHGYTQVVRDSVALERSL